MTAQSPEEIAYSLVHDSFKESNPKYGDLIVPFNSEYFKMFLIKKIAAAILAERERARIVLPKRKSGEYWGKPPVGFAESVRAHNDCLDEIARLNPDMGEL